MGKHFFLSAKNDPAGPFAGSIGKVRSTDSSARWLVLCRKLSRRFLAMHVPGRAAAKPLLSFAAGAGLTAEGGEGLLCHMIT